MIRMRFLHRFAAAKLTLSLVALLAVSACAQPPAPVTPPGSPDANAATAPNANNPYASDPLDPNMNPHYVRHGGK
jgi:hypothetical protein